MAFYLLHNYMDFINILETWIYVNKVDTFFESYFETNPLSSYFIVSENSQTQTI